MTCKLCKTNSADKTNSHLIPFFLLKSMVTPSETKRTEKEISFDLSKPGFVNYFLGRELLPEKIQEVLGRDKTEKEIKTNNNFFSVDYTFCSSCEDKFTRIESLFSSNIFPSLKKLSVGNLKDPLILNETNSLITKLFCYSVIWRLAVTNYREYKIPEATLEKLDKILNLCLSTVEKEVAPNAIQNKGLINNHKIALSYFDDLNVKNSKFVFFEPEKTNPRSFFINGLSIYFFNNNSAFSKKGNNFFGLEKSINRKEIHKTDYVIVFKNTTQQIVNGVDKMTNLVVNGMLKVFRFNFNYIYTRMRGAKPEQQLVNYYIRELIDDDYTYADKFSVQRIAYLTKKYCS